MVNNNVLRIRIMLKDSLLVDKSFHQFAEMCGCAESRGVNVWMEKKEELEILPKTSWDADLMNLELTRLVGDFTKERLRYCQAIIRQVYGIHEVLSQAETTSKTVNASSGYYRSVGDSRQASGEPGNNSKDYKDILSGVTEMSRILKNNKTDDGRIWLYDDIEKIQRAAKQIDKACNNINKRRG